MGMWILAQLMKRRTFSSRWTRLFSSSSLFGAGQPCDYSTNSPRLPCVACAISSSWVSSQLALFFLSFFLVALPLPPPLLAFLLSVDCGSSLGRGASAI